MDRKAAIHGLIGVLAFEVLEFIRDREPNHQDRWVPMTEINDDLDLRFHAVPKAGEQHGEKGWFLAIVARKLEDDGLVEYKKEGARSFIRSA